MRIAIVGTRGIPARYGGFETFAEELACRLARGGHDVVVYCRKGAVPDVGGSYHGVRLVALPTLRRKYLDTVVHTFLSVLHLISHRPRPDVVVVCNGANAVLSWIPRLFGSKTVLNVDGIERLRRKWGWVGRLWYRVGETLARLCPTAVVADARVIQDYYQERHRLETVYIPYGGDHDPNGTARASTGRPAPAGRIESGSGNGHDILARLGLRPDDYLLYVSRLEPENNAHLVVEAFEKLRTDKRLVVVGDAPYSHAYIRRLRSTRDERILFPGGVYGEGYRQLQRNAYAYVQATEVGGTHPALVEAMCWGGMVVANDTPENREVLGEAGLLYRLNDVDDLRRSLRTILECPEIRSRFRQQSRRRVAQHYSWDRVTAAYLALFRRLTLSAASGAASGAALESTGELAVGRGLGRGLSEGSRRAAGKRAVVGAIGVDGVPDGLPGRAP